MRKHVMRGVCVLGLALAIGCSDDDEPSVAQEVFAESCSDVCERWDECRAAINVDDCIDQCEEADDNDVLDERIDACDDCVEEGSCQEIDACWQNCPLFPAMG